MDILFFFNRCHFLMLNLSVGFSTTMISIKHYDLLRMLRVTLDEICRFFSANVYAQKTSLIHGFLSSLS